MLSSFTVRPLAGVVAIQRILMRNPRFRLAAIALSTAAGVFLAPVMASAQAPTNLVTTTMTSQPT